MVKFEEHWFLADADDPQVLWDLGEPLCWNHIRITTQL